jgi:hypothetical protein
MEHNLLPEEHKILEKERWSYYFWALFFITYFQFADSTRKITNGRNVLSRDSLSKANKLLDFQYYLKDAQRYMREFYFINS